MLYISEGGINRDISHQEFTDLTKKALNMLSERRKVLILPPDYSRIASQAGVAALAAYKFYGSAVTDILPATGTHIPMTPEEINRMYPGLPQNLFRTHNWRKDVKTLGRIPADFIREISSSELDFDWPVQVNSLLSDGGHDLILSIGQVVPHEVVGMANHNKNLFVGTGGVEAINKSHYIGAVHGLEKLMGQIDTPVRRLFNRAQTDFGKNLPVVYVQTVVAADADGLLKLRGVYIGDDDECFKKAAKLSQQVNITRLPGRMKRITVFLQPDKFRSTWIGNKAIYRSRMAIIDGGELNIIAPGVDRFGEDPGIDALIRKYGYRGTEATVRAVKNNKDLRNSLATAAHLIHSSTEGRFRINFAAGGLSSTEITSAGFNSLDLTAAKNLFKPEEKKAGINLDAEGNEFYLIKNAGIGLWTAED
ncbi:MAG: lactate racemase domain-containing protein [Spirochaetales bacterium]|uniref:Lactate racemase domain-containing protein n=1 Tax=Candidatus Thalassospirochaeta sargassi TaxID=3119039 RepID=A0AAJ1IJV3_9SPIO|nr:lactate racemase domain-containing protein [Spirochaetales bacterium]